jgi:hypothetical protein
MRVIITESQNAILRRYGRIKELFDNYLLVHNVTAFDTFESFFQALCWDIAVDMIDRTKMDQDSYVTLRNQMIQFVKNHFYEDYKEWWERRTNRINESVDSKKKLFIDLLGEDLINSIRKITSAKELPLNLIDNAFDKTSNRVQQHYIDLYGPLYYFVFDGEPFIYRRRVTDTGEEHEIFTNSKGESFYNGQITNRLGLHYTGLKFSDIIDMFINEKEDNSPLNENVDKNKKFLTNVMGVDFTGKIEQVTSVYDVPYNFYRKGIFTMPDVASYLNRFGPMYIFELDGRRFIYQDRGRYESFISEDGIVYEDKIPEQLGIDIMGLRFSDIVNMYFNEDDDVITEDEDKMLRNKAQRRMGFIDQHVNELERDDVCEYWTEDEVDDYVDSSMSNIVQQVCEQIGSFDLYNELYEYLVDNGYKSQFRDFFIDTHDNYC